MLRFIQPRTLHSVRNRRWFSNIVVTPCGLHIDRDLPRNFDKILIANRGEIAVRVMRTAKQLGVKTVAVFSDADADSLHVSMADEAIHIGPSTAADSYLKADTILDVCRQTGAQAVHPGYGFMSENAEFADDCAKHGIVFIGPPASAILSMGSKSASKKIMIAAGVPVVPGYHGEDQSVERLREEADKCGFPLMIKAVLGGGGKGMRVVHTREEFDDMLDACKREAMKSFKDERVLLERYIQRPRHIEFQVFADTHGSVVHLHERDCSVQRRHQKVLEEAPAPGMSEALRTEMGLAAVNAAKAVGYEGAGTVEFIFDAVTDEYYFMEMNTRLQVEHPVTEMVMRRDLVQWQLHVAAGHPLPAQQSELASTGHALEARIYAENPHNNFLPATGVLTHLSAPALTHDCRVETGVRQDDEVSMYYDPMISKLIVSAPDRASALQRMSQALDEYHVVGPPTNIEFLKIAVNHPAFQKGKVETGFIDEHIDLLIPPVATPSHPVVAMACLSLLRAEADEAMDNAAQEDEGSPWSASSSFRLNMPDTRELKLLTLDASGEEAGEVVVTVEEDGDDYIFTFSDGEVLTASGVSDLDGEGQLEALLGASRAKARVIHEEDVLHVFLNGSHVRLGVPHSVYGGGTGAAEGSCTAPMAGKVVKLSVVAGQAVKAGDAVAIMEAMKMEHVIQAPKDGVVEDVFFGVGDFVDGGKVVVSFVAEEEEA